MSSTKRKCDWCIEGQHCQGRLEYCNCECVKDLQSTEKCKGLEFSPEVFSCNVNSDLCILHNCTDTKGGCNCELRISDTNNKHQWYVIGSYESEITNPYGWADLKLECIADHDCNKTATVMVNNIDPNRIRVEDHE